MASQRPARTCRGCLISTSHTVLPFPSLKTPIASPFFLLRSLLPTHTSQHIFLSAILSSASPLPAASTQENYVPVTYCWPPFWAHLHSGEPTRTCRGHLAFLCISFSTLFLCSHIQESNMPSSFPEKNKIKIGDMFPPS